ncbi:uncharacterized protein [Prorops nasuta]|uniref:uncharacterized protein n=1 Tax=Prorops nasuta TaxID=863751 RepID=UPI0034CDB877
MRSRYCTVIIAAIGTVLSVTGKDHQTKRKRTERAMARGRYPSLLSFSGRRFSGGVAVRTRSVVVLDLEEIRWIREERRSSREANNYLADRMLETWSFREDFDFLGLRWLQDSGWRRINFQMEDPWSEWEPEMSEQEVLEWHGLM